MGPGTDARAGPALISSLPWPSSDLSEKREPRVQHPRAAYADAGRGVRPSGSAAAHPVRDAAAGLFGDLFRDAFVPRPLPPLDRLPLPSRVRQALPAVVREVLRWAPHAGVLVLCLLLVRLQTQSEVIALDKLTGGILVAVALLMTLCWPVLSAWLLMLASAVSLFHLGGLAGPFPFADVKSWPDVLLDAQGRPWAVAGSSPSPP